MHRILLSLVLAVTLLGRPAVAQENVWVQIEAQPTLSEAQRAIRLYAQRLQDVNGFSLDGGWYAIALGPYSRDDAGEVLRVLRSEGAIPRDAYIAFSSAYRQQFYPVGAALNDPATATATEQPEVETTTLPAQGSEPGEEPAAEPEATATAEAEPERPAIPDESPAEARRSESLLSREERMQLQVMLQWAGFYDAGIDGAFGRGTRSSMADWQQANGFEPTGVLTSYQRNQLETQYNSVLDGLGVKLVRDDKAGIEIKMPTEVVALKDYEAPFAHYDASTDLPARVILVSQEGDRNTLRGLYEIMQTLEIVPQQGERQRRDTAFTIEGRNSRIVSHTEVSLDGGVIKGFTLVWPVDDEERRTRLLDAMQTSFRTLPAVLPASAGLDEEQSVDLVSGLQVRRPVKSRSGFYVDGRGTVVTVAEAVNACGRVTIDHDIEAQVLSSDADTGLAVLRPTGQVAPIAAATFSGGVPRLKSDVAVAGYPYEGVLNAPTLTFGQLADLRGLNGEENVRRLALAAQAGDAGGPVFDAGGAVLGVLLPPVESAQKLPEDVSFAVDAGAVRQALSAAGVEAATGEGGSALDPEDLIRIAESMTVLVSCWD